MRIPTMTPILLAGLLAGCLGNVVGDDEALYTTSTNNTFGTLSINGSPTATPAHLQADLNIKLRGMAEVTGERKLVDINGPTDAKAPKINTLFVDRRVPGMERLYKVGVFGGIAQGQEGGYPVHVVAFVTKPGEVIRAPESGYDIGQGKTALVLHADADSLTLKYTREDSIVGGYAIHLIGLQVSPALLGVYNSCVASGRHSLPAVNKGQALGAATGALKVSVRDTGQFMDPRAKKDWYDGSGPVEPTPGTPPPANPPANPPSNPPPSNPPPSNPPPSNPPPSNPPPSNPPANGTSCSASGVTFKLSGVPKACGLVNVTVTAGQGHAWVLVGLAAPGGGTQWKGGASNVGCSGGSCHWTFTGLKVPCQAGPYTVHLMKDAVGDNPAAGKLIASCNP